jgi:hypothetical protein
VLFVEPLPPLQHSHTFDWRVSGDPAPLTGALQNALEEVRMTLPATRLLTMALAYLTNLAEL